MLSYALEIPLEDNTQHFEFRHYELEDDEKGVPLYWFWDDYGKTEEICASLGASDFTTSQKGALARIAMHAHYEALSANRPIHYSRSKNASLWRSSRIKKRHFFSYDLIIHAMDFLEAHGLISHQKGVAGVIGRQSEFRATFRLIANMSCLPYRMLSPDDPIILRNVDNEELEIPKAREYQRMSKRVNSQNDLILGTSFTSLPVLKSPLRRIFRYDMQHLGRFYTIGASWQNVRRTTRRLIELDGQKTTLLDYSACNPNIAYRLIQAAPPENPYNSESFCRSDAKLALMILLNAKDKAEAIRAVAFSQQFNGSGCGDLLRRRDEADLLISELEAIHATLVEAGMFFGSGLTLMRAESDMADKVMTELRNLGVVALPIHDGFIVKREHKQILEEAMREHSKLNSLTPIPISVEY